jgi:hypothetical protein
MTNKTDDELLNYLMSIHEMTHTELRNCLTELMVQLRSVLEKREACKDGSSHQEYWHKKGTALTAKIIFVSNMLGESPPELFADCQDEDDFMEEIETVDNVSTFLDIAYPSDALPLTDELFNKLVAAEDFLTLKKDDFDYLRDSGFLFNPTRRSFVQSEEPNFDFLKKGKK